MAKKPESRLRQITAKTQESVGLKINRILTLAKDGTS